MRRSIGFSSVMVLILGLALAACGGTPTGLNPEIRLSFEGSVTSAADGMPIQGAAVNFVNCALGCRTKETTLTDAAGRYALTVRERCALGTNPIFDSLEAVFGFRVAIARPVCTTATQTIDFELE